MIRMRRKEVDNRGRAGGEECRDRNDDRITK